MKINIINHIKKSLFFSLLSRNLYSNTNNDLLTPVKYCSFRKVRDYLTKHEYTDDIYSTEKINYEMLYKPIHKKYYNKNYNKNYKKKINQYRLTAEHIYPQSLTKRYKLAKNDAHNIYLTIQSHNNYRNNYKFVDETNFTYYQNFKLYLDNNLPYHSTYNYKNTKLHYYIPLYKSRGIIARTLAYMKIVYPDLVLSEVIDKSTLIEWNFKYPPDKYEKYKNTLCYRVQGNRNIFIDNYYLLNKYIDYL